MYLQANPAKEKSQQEKDEAKQRYTLGEQVLPPVARVRMTSVDEEDRRVIEEVRQMSLQEVGVGSSQSHGRSTRHRDSDAHRDSRPEEARRQRRRDHDRRRRNDTSVVSSQMTSSSPHETMDPRIRARQIEHQSSLRSLISSSDFDSSDIDEEVLRQIIDELLQDGLDLDNLNAIQEDELTDRIANALRQGRRLKSEDNRPSQSRESNHISQRSERDQAGRRRHGRSSTAVDQSVKSSQSPVSRPHLLHTYPVSHGNRQRTSSDHRRQTSPAAVILSGRSSEARRPVTSTATLLSDSTPVSNHQRRQSPSSQGRASTRASPEAHRQATRSSTDLTNPPSSSPPERTQSLDTSDRRRSFSDLGRQREDNPQEIRNQNLRTGDNVEPDLVADSKLRNTNTLPISADTATATLPTSAPSQIQTIVIEDSRRHNPPYPTDNLSAMQTTSPVISSAIRSGPGDFSINCNRCEKPHLEQELHQNCSVCLDGNFNLCLRCYRQGLGCFHWFGFGHAAPQRYKRQAPPDGYPLNHFPPHVLLGHRYIYVSLENTGAAVGKSADQAATANGRSLQSGVFCSKCGDFADQCYWKCDSCNEGEWGFCNRCVNQGQCCSHPLLPIAHTSTQPSSDVASEPQHTRLSVNPFTNLESKTSLQHRSTFPLGSYVPLTFSRRCNICKYLIPSRTTHFHCPQCNDGDYDICTTCYLNLSQIAPENGPKGWRRCPSSHRMTVVRFDDSPVGQQRVVANDLVGGHALKDDIPGPDLTDQPMLKDEEFTWRDGQLVQIHTITRQHSSTSSRSPRNFPPDGGFGKKALALWSYWPDAEAIDELGFPKGAVVSEVEDINGDWFWGIYARSKGLFPGNHVKILEDVAA